MAGVHTDARSGVRLWPEGGHNQPLAVGAGTGFHTVTTERRDGRGPRLTQGRGSTLARYGGPCAAVGRVNRGTPQE